MGGGVEAMGAPTLSRAPFAHPQRAAGAASSPRSAARCRYGQRCSARWGRRPTAAVGPGGGGHAISSSAHSGAHSAARPCKERSAHAAPRRLLGVPRRCCWEHPLPRGRAPRGHTPRCPIAPLPHTPPAVPVPNSGSHSPAPRAAPPCPFAARLLPLMAAEEPTCGTASPAAPVQLSAHTCAGSVLTQSLPLSRRGPGENTASRPAAAGRNSDAVGSVCTTSVKNCL